MILLPNHVFLRFSPEYSIQLIILQEGLLASDSTLLNVADILSIMASRSIGRCHLLYGERGETFSRTRSVNFVFTIYT